MAEMDIVQVFAELGDGMDGCVGDVAALGKDKIAQAWRGIDDLLNSGIRESRARSQVENSEVLVDLAIREAQESVVVDEFAASKAQLTQAVALGEQCGNRSVANLVALVQIDLENVGAVIGEGKNGVIAKLGAFVQFQLATRATALASCERKHVRMNLTDGMRTHPLDVLATLRQRSQALVGNSIAS